MEIKKQLRKLLKRRKAISMKELKKEFATRCRMSLFRDLKQLEYYSSYSHTGRYYTLRDIPRFDLHGLWRYDDVGFSRYGTLKETVYQLVEKSQAGYYYEELQELLKIRVHNTLLDLVESRRLCRVGKEKKYLYVSSDTSRAQKQCEQRENLCKEDIMPLAAETVIEILAEVIRGKRICVLVEELMKRLYKRGVHVNSKQVEEVLSRYGVKKTLVSS